MLSTTATDEHRRPARAPRIAVVEDHREEAEQLKLGLERDGFDVLVFGRGQDLLEQIDDLDIDLVTLDLRLPGEDGMELARNIRVLHDVPIVVVTGITEQTQELCSYAAGVDDYVTKPVRIPVLIARIRAVLRRSRSASTDEDRAAAAVVAAGGTVTFEGWRFDVGGRRLWSSSGTRVEVTAAECNMLAVFVASARETLSRHQIVQRLRERLPDDANRERALRSTDVTIGRLRKKLAEHDRGDELIVTMRSEGYMFSAEVRPV